MEVEEFREKVKAGMIARISGRDIFIKEVVKFRFDDGTFYIKCWLADGRVLADDLNENMFILVKGLKTPFKKPFGNELEFDTKKFYFLYTAHAVASETQGEEIFQKGKGERFWDYKAEDNSYLSLGEDDETGKRMDFYGRILGNDSIELHEITI